MADTSDNKYSRITIRNINTGLWEKLRLESVRTKEPIGSIINGMLLIRYKRVDKGEQQ